MNSSQTSGLTSAEVRSQLIHALELDLVGAKPDEILPLSPTNWYLTGFLAPYGAPPDKRSDTVANDTIDLAGKTSLGDDDELPESAPNRKAFFPSSIGLSFLVPAEVTKITAIAQWGDYHPVPEPQTTEEGTPPQNHWQRIPRREEVEVALEQLRNNQQIPVPNSDGLVLMGVINEITAPQFAEVLPHGTRSVSCFLVNTRRLDSHSEKDCTYIFQARLEIQSHIPFTPRPDPRTNATDQDEKVADLQYRSDFEYAVGHNISAGYTLDSLGDCYKIFTTWIPTAEVEKVVPDDIPDVELTIENLANVTSPDALKALLNPMVSGYRSWIDRQRQSLAGLSPARLQVANELYDRAWRTSERMQKGIEAMDDPQVFLAFQLANRAIAMSIRQRLSHNSDRTPEQFDPPKWRPFQLAFILTNLTGIANPLHSDREIVDLLFFPTGGGKTEAYLGLSAFTLILRRLKDPSIYSAGLSVLMRYTLRLLTLDQLGRAATLVCALETIRQENIDTLGKHPFAIGLWVGLSATPNRMGSRRQPNSDNARDRVIAFRNDSRRPSPIPLENCPWCGTRFDRNSFHLLPNNDEPTDLRITCSSRRCQFTGRNPLPILAVDDQIYRRLPAFLIATVDKFANLPWVGQTGKLFGKVSHCTEDGTFYSPADLTEIQGRRLERELPPPDLIIQDELHLISGPLGTMVGLYETAVDRLSSYEIVGQTVRPKIIASTATVRRATDQIRALFGRSQVDIFPPPGSDRRDSFFAKTVTTNEANARTYVGIAAPGRSLKVVMLRAYLVLLSIGQKLWQANGGRRNPQNPADPYMTLLGYFNSLRELGGSRRIVEDEVSTRLQSISRRMRHGETVSEFSDRTITEPLELTSRIQTNEVSETKRRLALGFHSNDRVDVALATNMISVGLDITRLGLMVVLGQPKTTAEYIQATSRVGRDDKRPGLVITLLNIHRPRDRSHYERFCYWHQIFYRSVEATSVTPFAPRAVDRGLPAITVALARLGSSDLTPPTGALEIIRKTNEDLQYVVEAITDRAEAHAALPDQTTRTLQTKMIERTLDLLDSWRAIAQEKQSLQYQVEVGVAPQLLYMPTDPELTRIRPIERKFKAQRSMRDVEKSVNLWLRNPDGIEEDGD